MSNQDGKQGSGAKRGDVVGGPEKLEDGGGNDVPVDLADDNQGNDVPVGLTDDNQGNDVTVGLTDDNQGNDVTVGLTDVNQGNDVPVGFARHTLFGQTAFPLKPCNPQLSRRRPAGAYGWHRDLPDPRDHWYSAPLADALPVQVDLRESGLLPPVYAQGELQSCAGNAVAAAIQFARARRRLPRAGDVPSRLFIYYNAREMANTVNVDHGAQLRDAIKSVASQGDCFETGGTPASADWPYDPAKVLSMPDRECYASALSDRVVAYSRLAQHVGQMKSCLASGHPFVFGFSVFAAFESPAVAGSGRVELPAAGDRSLGGHAVLAVGYDDAQQRFIVRNSWGEGWGQSGYFTMPYLYLADAGLAGDFWTIRCVSVAGPSRACA